MIQVMAFADFHDSMRVEKFAALAAALNAKLPFGVDPLYSYSGSAALPEALNHGELVYLSDIVFHSAVAWYSAGPAKVDLPAISAYASWSEFRNSPNFRVSRPRPSPAVADYDRAVYVLRSAQVDKSTENREAPRRTEGGVNEYCYRNWAECSLTLPAEPIQVLSHESLPISPELHAALCLEDMRLENLARIPGSFGVLGFHHVDDDFLVSVRGNFWESQEAKILIL